MNSSWCLGKLLLISYIGAVVSACAATSRVQPYASYLEPEPGPYTLVYEGGLYNHDYEALFWDMPRSRRVQMVSVNGGASEAVFLDFLDEECDRVEVVHVLLPQQEGERRDASVDRARKRKITKALLDCQTATLVDTVWSSMLSEVRYYPGVRGVGDGTMHHFSYARSGMMARSGFTDTPDENSVAAKCVGLGKLLGAYADAVDIDKGPIRLRLVVDSQQLLKALRTRRPQADGKDER